MNQHERFTFVRYGHVDAWLIDENDTHYHYMAWSMNHSFTVDKKTRYVENLYPYYIPECLRNPQSQSHRLVSPTVNWNLGQS